MKEVNKSQNTIHPQKQPAGGNGVNGNEQERKRVSQLATVMPSGAAVATKVAEKIRAVSPDPLPSPEGHDDMNPNYDRVSIILFPNTAINSN